MLRLLSSLCCFWFGFSALAANKPNILYIMSDDHAAHAIGAYGGRLASLNPTPVIDRLAKEGMLFENAFSTNSICSPSRACVITGQYAHTNGAYDLGGKIEAKRQFLALEMKKAGYQTAMIGKWHLKEEPGAFDFYSVLPGQGIADLEETGQMDNTVIIYTADQGFMLGEHDYQDKRWMYEESMRMPFLIRYPKTIPAGKRTDAIVENVDFAPTLLAFAGAETPDYMQGRSFKAICESGIEPPDWKQAAYYRYWMHMAHHDNPGHLGIRAKEFKLIFYYGANDQGGYRTPPAWELYNLRNDPHETVNEYDNPEYAQKVAELKKQLAALRQEVGDTGEDYPKIEKIVQEFWDDDAEDRAKAAELSHQFLQIRKEELQRKAEKK